jgi:oligopeptidase B
LLDVDKMAEGKAYFAASGFSVSEDNQLLAYGVDEVSRRQYTIYVKNLATGETYKDAIANTEGLHVGQTTIKLFYTSKNDVTLLSEKIKRHTLGSDAKADVVVYDEKDKSNYIGISKSKNNQFIFIYSGATLSTELRMINANEPMANFKVFAPRMKEVIYDVVTLDNKFLIVTNKDGAKNFKLMECALDKTDAASWKEVIPHRADVLLQSVEEFKDFIVLNERKDGLVKLVVRNLADNSENSVDFGEATYAASIGSTPDYNSKVFRYNYTSLTTPNSVYDYEVATKKKILKKQLEVVGGYKAEDYVTERLMATAKDGTKVPISLVYKKGFKKDGNAPLLLYAYGSYGNSIDASFNSSRLTLLDRGFAYAIAHIRGGQEMGRQWYEDGKMMKKKNTFTDFVDCGEFLVKEKYTSSKHLYAQGGSAGGLLMGAVINLAPNLWNGVIAQVPFVDVVNTMLDESIPLTTNEFDEWGNPKNKDAYFYMKSYSPYENVEAKAIQIYW